MSTLKVDEIVDKAGTGAPNFPGRFRSLEKPVSSLYSEGQTNKQIFTGVTVPRDGLYKVQYRIQQAGGAGTQFSRARTTTEIRAAASGGAYGSATLVGYVAYTEMFAYNQGASRPQFEHHNEQYIDLLADDRVYIHLVQFTAIEGNISGGSARAGFAHLLIEECL